MTAAAKARTKKTIANTYHGTETTVLALADYRGPYLSPRQYRTALMRLCGSLECRCSGVGTYYDAGSDRYYL